MLIYFARHAKAAHNLGQAFGGGQTDTEVLEEGVNNTKTLARRFFAVASVDMIVSSTLLRSRQTAQVFQDICRNQQGQALPWRQTDLLREVDVGDFTGRDKLAVEKLYPEAAQAFYTYDIPRWQFPKGEDYQLLRTRAAALLAFLGSLSAESILVIGHSMYNRVILQCLFPAEEALWRNMVFDHNEVVMVDAEKKTYKVIRL